MDSRIFTNKALWQLWTYCLMQANHKKRWVSVQSGKGETEVEVQEGQFLFGRNKWAVKLKTKPSTLWKQMLKLKTFGFLNIQSGNLYSIVTINNWDIYQNKYDIKEQQKEQPTVNQVKANGKPSDTNKNVKKVKNDIYSQFFDEIWSKYPKRDGKRDALRHFNATVKNDKDVEDIRKALSNYLQSDTVKNGYIKNGSTWFHNWRDWIDNPVDNLKAKKWNEI